MHSCRQDAATGTRCCSSTTCGRACIVTCKASAPELIGRVTGPLPERLTFAMRADLMSVLMHINGIRFTKVKADMPRTADTETAESASAVAVECWLEGRTINPGAVSRMRQAGQ